MLLDELGRGTSTSDGAALAYAAVAALLKRPDCLTVFVTHYAGVARDLLAENRWAGTRILWRV